MPELPVNIYSGGQAIIYSENFEDGVANGFTLNGLWHVTQNFPKTGSYCLGYVRNETPGGTPNGNYNIGYSGPKKCFGPAISLLSGSTITGYFDVFVGDEFNLEPQNFDQFSIWSSLDGSTLNTVLASSAPSAGGVVIPEWGGVPGYNTIIVNLTPWAGSTIYLAYQMDTFDDLFNAYPGIRIDNIQVISSSHNVPLNLYGRPADVSINIYSRNS